MKRVLLFLLVTFACFNIAGGRAVAASALTPPAADKVQLAQPAHLQQAKVLQGACRAQLLQGSLDESEEEETLLPPLLVLRKLSAASGFAPTFRAFNKHFLVNYSAVIKAGLPAAYLLHHLFRL